MTETIRVLKVGGEARIYGLSPKRSAWVLSFLSKNFPAEVSKVTIVDGLFTYKKTSHVIWPKKIIFPKYDRNVAYGHDEIDRPGDADNIFH